jgi:hypothetical protein
MSVFKVIFCTCSHCSQGQGTNADGQRRQGFYPHSKRILYDSIIIRCLQFEHVLIMGRACSGTRHILTASGRHQIIGTKSTGKERGSYGGDCPRTQVTNYMVVSSHQTRRLLSVVWSGDSTAS